MTISSLPLYAGDRPPGDYDRPPEHAQMIRETDVAVPMRDGVKLAVDVYRRQAPAIKGCGGRSILQSAAIAPNSSFAPPRRVSHQGYETRYRPRR